MGFLFPLYYLFRAAFYTVATNSWEGTIHLWWVRAVWLTSAQSIKFSFVFTVNCVQLPGHKHVDLQNSHRSHVAPGSSPPGQPEHPRPRSSSKASTGGGSGWWAHLSWGQGSGSSAPHTPRQPQAPGPRAQPSQTEKSKSINLKTVIVLFKIHDYLNTFQVWQRNMLSNPTSISYDHLKMNLNENTGAILQALNSLSSCWLLGRVVRVQNTSIITKVPLQSSLAANISQ